ncbi:MAG: hypothetical protein DDT30_01201 [Dehalococcoidia bacterium]|nr:hypothetical protein [Bacillota bacterium]
MTETSVNVRCSGRMHKISIMPDGAFVLHNHTKAEIDAERILAALGGGLCRCVQVLDAWRQLNDRRRKEKLLPVGLRSNFKEAIALHEKRERQRWHVGIMHVDKLTIPIDERIYAKNWLDLNDMVKSTTHSLG